MGQYSVKKVAKMAGVSVRTLHHYDQIGLLKPSIRTEKNYRLYSKKELLRLQQILFYRNLNFPLKEIADILDNPDFEIQQALVNHKAHLQQQQQSIKTLIATIDKTLLHLKKQTKMTVDELYDGFPKGKAYREEAAQKWSEAVKQSENHLRKKTKAEFNKLKKDFDECWNKLGTMYHLDPTSDEVQVEITKHYHLTRAFWGTAQSDDKQAKAYAGLGEMYTQDERFSKVNGVPTPDFAAFMKKAMAHFASTL